MNGQKLNLIWILCCFWCGIFAQSTSPNIQTLFEKAIGNGTLKNQQMLIDQALFLQQQSANSNFLPKLSLNAAANYQTDVTSINVPVPGIEILPPFKDQYKVTLDLQQNIYDGGATKALRKFNTSSALVEKAKADTENVQLKDLVSQLYFGAALSDLQNENVLALKQQIEFKINRAEENYKLGNATKLSVQQLKSKSLELDQQIVDLKFKKQSLIEGINILTGLSLSPDTQFEIDQSTNFLPSNTLLRSELKLFQAQQQFLINSEDVIKSKYAPKLAFSASLGYGRPGLNFLARNFDTYGVFGLNLKIPIDHFYTRAMKNELSLNGIQVDKIKSQIDNFTSYQKVKISNQENEIERLRSTLSTDEKLIEMKNNMMTIIEDQFNNGIITQREYLEELENVTLAKNSLALHQTQLAQAIIQYQLLTGTL